MARTHILGFPRIGAQRELKTALEAFWRGEIDEAALQGAGRQLRERHWSLQREAGLSLLTAGDFAFYDHMLQQCQTLGALPARFGFDARRLTLAQGFELARGNAAQPAMEMTKWFDTNYHYLVPELAADTRFGQGDGAWLAQIDEALRLGMPVKPALVGPVTFLRLAKTHTPGFDRLQLLPALCEAYREVLAQLRARCIEWVQLDESALCLDLDDTWLGAAERAYDALAGSGVKLLLGLCFDAAEPAQRIARLPVQGFHLDLARAPRQLDAWLPALPRDAVLSAGIVDGRNIWRADLRKALSTLQPLHDALGDRLWVAPSCSLLHVPVSRTQETRLDTELQSWLAFATEKLREIRLLADGLDHGVGCIADALLESDRVQGSRRDSRRVTNPLVRKRLATVTDAMAERQNPFPQRIERQRTALQLPPLPTTTIGSFPQTAEIRKARAAHKRGELPALDYLRHMREQIRIAIEKQEALGLDVLVHGEAERNDMVEYFGEQIWGYAFTEHGWVQSYGSRCVKPPILFGDAYRPEPMTVETAVYAQSLTGKPVKGMLTGPVTMLQWSFVRDDQPREATLLQLALAIRDEVLDLEKAGIRIIQIDEPAFREGLPLKPRDHARYLAQAVRAFKLAAGGVRDETQIHTHMCYSEFNDILPSIAAMDADVITIETSRSNMELLGAFGEFAYPNEIGPGVYDIHSPRIPSAEAMRRLMERAASVIPVERLWVNPDCGLKTRGWPEVEAALEQMVQATRELRAQMKTAAEAAVS